MAENRTAFGTDLSTGFGCALRYVSGMRVADRPDLWKRLCELAGLEPSASVDALHQAIPTVGRGTIQRIGDGGSPRYDSLQKIADHFLTNVPDLLGKPSEKDDPQHRREALRGVSQPLRHLPIETPPTVTWESVLIVSQPLPPKFCLAVPDDALAPRTPKGTMLIFELDAKPNPGDGVLVEDRHGERHVRRYLPGLGGAWLAGAHNDAYPQLDSARDGLRLIAAAVGRMSGSV